MLIAELSGSPLLPVFACVGPAALLVGFFMLMIGISGRNDKMKKWGLTVAILAALGTVISLLIAVFNAR